MDIGRDLLIYHVDENCKYMSLDSGFFTELDSQVGEQTAEDLLITQIEKGCEDFLAEGLSWQELDPWEIPMIMRAVTTDTSRAWSHELAADTVKLYIETSNGGYLIDSPTYLMALGELVGRDFIDREDAEDLRLVMEDEDEAEEITQESTDTAGEDTVEFSGAWCT